MTEENSKSKQLLTVNQFAKQYPAFNQGGLRNYIFFENSNGLKQSKAILRIGRKILIDVDRFFAWIDSLNNKRAS